MTEFPPISPRLGAKLFLLATLLNPSVAANAAVMNGDFTSGSDGLLHWISRGEFFNTGDQAVLSDAARIRTILWQGVEGPTGTAQFSFDLLTSLVDVTVPGSLPDSFFVSLYFLPQADLFDPEILGSGSVTPIADFDDRGIDFPTFAASGLISSPSAKGPAYREFTYTFFHPGGAVVPVFELNDLNGFSGDSIVAVDNVIINFVPEPSGPLLLSIASIFLLSLRKRPVR